MISRVDLVERVQEWGLREDVVEKDYVIGWLLWAIGAVPRLSLGWAFKGGTCLKKCYLETYRFSEDLDFTVLPGGPLEADELVAILKDVFGRIYDQAGIDFRDRAPFVRMRPDGNSAEVRVYYRGPRNAPQVAGIKLDLTRSELVVQPTILRPISHPYPDQLPPPATVRCYGFEEVFAEKLRAMGERSRPRDLYDIVNLFRRPEFRSNGELVRSVYVQKCQSKGVPAFTFASIEASPHRSELQTEWANMLDHQLPALPPFEDFWQELPNIYSWLDGKPGPQELPAISLGNTEEAEWKPPATVWVWGQGISLEPVRFAAANRLCVELSYGGSTRLIEPYSLRQTSDGHLLLYAVKAKTGELRSYRVDRIVGVKVTTTPFKARYAVELSSAGAMIASPPTRRGELYTPTRSAKGGVVYVMECSYCRKQFRRSTYDTNLRPHKDRSGFDCPGRVGYEVDRHYL